MSFWSPRKQPPSIVLPWSCLYKSFTHLSGSAGVFGYTVYWGISFHVYSIFVLKIGYKLFPHDQFKYTVVFLILVFYTSFSIIFGILVFHYPPPPPSEPDFFKFPRWSLTRASTVVNVLLRAIYRCQYMKMLMLNLFPRTLLQEELTLEKRLILYIFKGVHCQQNL